MFKTMLPTRDNDFDFDFTRDTGESDPEVGDWIQYLQPVAKPMTAKQARELEQAASALINSKGIIYGCDLAEFMYEIEGY